MRVSEGVCVFLLMQEDTVDLHLARGIESAGG